MSCVPAHPVGTHLQLVVEMLVIVAQRVLVRRGNPWRCHSIRRRSSRNPRWQSSSISTSSGVANPPGPRNDRAPSLRIRRSTGPLVHRTDRPGADDHAVVRGRRHRAQQHRLLIVDDRVRKNDHVAIGHGDAVGPGLAKTRLELRASSRRSRSSPRRPRPAATARPAGPSESPARSRRGRCRDCARRH